MYPAPEGADVTVSELEVRCDAYRLAAGRADVVVRPVGVTCGERGALPGEPAAATLAVRLAMFWKDELRCRWFDGRPKCGWASGAALVDEEDANAVRL